jgi:hypothetical protein
MKRTLAILLAVVMALPASAAAASKRFTEQDPELLRQYAGKLPIGSVVKVRLRDGGRLKGILMAADQDGVVVKPKTRIPEPERRVPFTNLEMLELDQPSGSNAAKAAAIGVASGVGTFLGLLAVIAAAWD